MEDFNTVIAQIKELLQKEPLDLPLIGSLLLQAVELMRKEVLFLFPPPPERQRTQKETKQQQQQQEEEPQDHSLSWLYSYTPKVGRPTGSPTLTLKEFFEQEIIPLHKEPNWIELAREVYERIQRGEFQIRSLRDFIAFLYAYMLYEEVEALSLTT